MSRSYLATAGMDQLAPTATSDVLDELVAFSRRFLVFTDPRHHDVLALWAAHTWAMPAFDTTMYLDIESPVKQSGKTRVLEVLELVVHRPWRITTPSDAVLFRKLAEQPTPTLLLDEVDAVFSKERAAEGLRATLNVGNRRGAVVPRAADFGNTLVDFHVFGAKAFAGLGNLPDTVADRSIPLVMARRTKREVIERLVTRDVAPEAAALRERVATATRDSTTALRDYRNKWYPDELGDRQLEGWEPLLAIADTAGGYWLERARDAAIAVHTAEAAEPGYDDLLLAHIREVFNERRVPRLPTVDIVEALVMRDDGPWAQWWGDKFDANGYKAASNLAHRLRRFRIHSRQYRVGEGSDERIRGYWREDFEATWERYL